MNYTRLLLIITLSVVTSSVLAMSFTHQGVAYNTLPDGNLEVGRNNECEANVIIPENVEYQGKTYRVTSVQDDAFSWLMNQKMDISPKKYFIILMIRNICQVRLHI